MPECEADEEALAHFFFSFCHRFESLLLVMNLLVFSHVSFVAEIIKVPCVCLRVQLWYKRGPGLTQSRPVDLGKVLVIVNILDVGEAPGA